MYLHHDNIRTATKQGLCCPHTIFWWFGGGLFDSFSLVPSSFQEFQFGLRCARNSMTIVGKGRLSYLQHFSIGRSFVKGWQDQTVVCCCLLIIVRRRRRRRGCHLLELVPVGAFSSCANKGARRRSLAAAAATGTGSSGGHQRDHGQKSKSRECVEFHFECVVLNLLFQFRLGGRRRNERCRRRPLRWRSSESEGERTFGSVGGQSERRKRS